MYLNRGYYKPKKPKTDVFVCVCVCVSFFLCGYVCGIRSSCLAFSSRKFSTIDAQKYATFSC